MLFVNKKHQRCNVILVLIDTLRADHLGCYGYGRRTSPNIDQFARESLLYEHAFSTASTTLLSVASLFTSKYVSFHSIGLDQGLNRGQLNPKRDRTLAQILKTSKGLNTAAFVSSVVLHRRTNFHLGFDEYYDYIPKEERGKLNNFAKDGAYTTRDGISWLRQNREKEFFLFIHYIDVHGPYINPSPYDRIFVHDSFYGEEKLLPYVYEGVGGIPPYQKTLAPYPYSQDARYYIAQYDGGIAYTDSLIGKLFSALKELKLYDQSLVIVTSDHGEALGERDIFFMHGLSVTHEQIHVPLLVKAPQAWSILPQRFHDPVSLVDLMPTIVQCYGIDPSCLGDRQGQCLPPFGPSGRNDPASFTVGRNRWLLSETYAQYALISPSALFLHPHVMVSRCPKILFGSKPFTQKKRIAFFKPDENKVEQKREFEVIRARYTAMRALRSPQFPTLPFYKRIWNRLQTFLPPARTQLLRDFLSGDILPPEAREKGGWRYLLLPIQSLVQLLFSRR